MMKSFLMVPHDDDQDDHINKVVTTWANQILDIAYDVEDGLKKIVLRVHGQSWWGIPRTLLDRRHVVEQMKELHTKVEHVGQRNLRYRLIDGASKAQNLSINTGPATDQTIYAFHEQSFQDTKYSPKAASSLVLPHTIENEIQEGQSYPEDDEMTMIQESLTHTSNVQGPVEEFQLIGREKEISDIIELILEHSSTQQQIQVIAVWGKGGVGKSTLISDIYHSQEVNQMFEKHAYVTVLQPFKLERLISSLAYQLDARKVASTKVADFTGLLDWCLQEKSCLIVLDDLSSTMEWDIILPCLLAMNSPSLVILITTRHEDIAKHCCKNPKCICLLNGLDEKGACDLFTQKVFKDKATDLTKHYPELVEPANLILKKCNGLPLAILTIGGFLAEQPTKTCGEWMKLDRCISLEMEMNPKFEGIKTVLMKSYDGLPYYLKSCILYLSIFLEDRIVSRRRLVSRWVAEGYSKDTSTAKRYFMELL
ncbi:hypothetical protein CFC21_085559 [Triticum aestivum]|uniref:NB-ARC domain-containing protein n=2 Tax=Triticum aestivum TaxID=4565 RepID=A0A3B6NYA8_WHEAT|nr:hypothetical protein CFC21_085559 [Triticum aestivum]